MPSSPEFWLRGSLPGIPGLLQPVAHALLQAQAEVVEALEDFPPEKLWERPNGVASVGFHLQHLRGVLDRLFTYAQDRSLLDSQLEELRLEGSPHPGNEFLPELLDRFSRQINHAIEALALVPEDSLTQPRAVGRAKLPSTVIGLLFHAAEHTMRHTGQLIVTARMLHHTK